MRQTCMILFLLLLAFSSTGDVYRVFVDREFGFWAVRTDNASHPINWTNKTLYVQTGDTVIWENGDGYGDRVTIISQNRLWNDTDAILGRINDRYGMTFNSSGTYTFYVKESSRVSFNISNQTANTTRYYDNETERWYYRKATGEVVHTDRFQFQRMYLKVTGNTIGLGTHPVGYYQQKTVINVSNMSQQPVPTPTPFKVRMKERERPVLNQTPTPTPTVTVMPLESYQEFTLFEVIKRWYLILTGG